MWNASRLSQTRENAADDIKTISDLTEMVASSERQSAPSLNILTDSRGFIFIPNVFDSVLLLTLQCTLINKVF